MASYFYMMRHGMTNDDLPGKEKVSGWLEVSLNQEGRSNAERAARILRKKGITSITASDTKRAAQSASIVEEVLGLPVVSSEKLRSWNMGSLQGMLLKAAKPFLAFFQENPDQTPPKGQTFEKFYRSFKGVWTTTVAYVKKFPNARPLLITHSQNIDLGYWFIEGIEPGEQLASHKIQPGEVVEVRINGDHITIRKVT